MATERARLLLGQFRKGEAVDPGAFVTSVAAVLARYCDGIITAVTDPRGGLAATSDWLPTIREVTEACERLATYDALQGKRENVTRETLARRDDDKDRTGRPTLEELREKHGPSWGMQPSAPSARPSDDRDRRDRERNERAILAEYARLGADPVYAGDVLVSPALVRNLSGRGILRRLEHEDLPEPPEAA